MDEREVLEYIVCKWCRGRGFNPAEYGPVKCPDCYGSGRIKVKENEDE